MHLNVKKSSIFMQQNRVKHRNKSYFFAVTNSVTIG
jgi:hypothetical protein